MKRVLVLPVLLLALGTARADDKEVVLYDSTDVRTAQKAESVTLYGKGDDDLSMLASFKKAKTITLADSDKVTDEGLAHLAKLGSLKSLTVKNCKKVTDEGVLAAAKNVRELRLEGLAVTDDLVRRLPASGPLRALELSKTEATDATLVELVKRKKLTELAISGDRFTEQGVAALAELTTLTELSVVAKDASDATFASIVKLPSLAKLVWYHPVASLEPLRDRGSLLALTLSVDEKADLEPLTTLRSLATLELWGALTDASLGPISRVPKLASLTLTRCRFSTQGLETIAKIATLRTLNLRDCCADRNVSFAAFAKSKLETLWLSDAAIDDERIGEIATFTSVTDLSLLIPKQVTRSGFVQLKRLAKLKSLYLRFEKGTPLQQSDVDGLQKALPKCNVLGIIRD